MRDLHGGRVRRQSLSGNGSLKVLHAIPSLAAIHGGPTEAMLQMAHALTMAGVEVTVITTDDDGRRARKEVPVGVPMKTAFGDQLYFRKQLEAYKVSLPLSRWVRLHLMDFDLVHVHALFSHASVATARAARRRGLPFIVRPLGVLNRYGMEGRRRWLKRLSFELVERPLLRAASAVHFTSEKERGEAERLGGIGVPAVIPLGFDLSPYCGGLSPVEFQAAWPEAIGREVILFLSRLDEKKGLDLLLRAFARVVERRAGALLVIAGSGERQFEASLRRLAGDLGIGRNVIWAGFLSGSLKLSALGAARAFALPSRSENFGIAAAEALAAGVPAVLSREVAIGEEAEAAGAALLAELEPGSLAEVLSRVLENPGLAQRLASNARALAMARYSLEGMGAALKALYERAVNPGGVAA